MKLTIIMYGYYLLFRYTAFQKEPFRQKLKERDLVLVMGAKDKNVARVFIFNKGRVSSVAGDSRDAECRLIWATESDGVSVMLDIARGNPKALMKAVMSGKLLLEGDAMAVAWYMSAVNMLGKMYLKKKK
jgi:trimethylamine-N-oxide reductase (cytochrome c)